MQPDLAAAPVPARALVRIEGGDGGLGDEWELGGGGRGEMQGRRPGAPV